MCMRRCGLGISIIFLLTQHGDSALMLAARCCRTDTVSLLLEAGAKIYLRNEVILVGENMPIMSVYVYTVVCDGLMCAMVCKRVSFSAVS